MTKLATLRLTVPIDDLVKVEDVQARLKNMLRGPATKAERVQNEGAG